MQNATSLKTNSTESPKTPGGISKSLLTPCRRIGLSRNWKKGGASPFVSPLSCEDVKLGKVETRKRKELVEEDSEKTAEDSNKYKIAIISEDSEGNLTHIDKTPSRNVDIPRRKRSKTLLSALNKTNSNAESLSSTTDDLGPEKASENDVKHQKSIPIDSGAVVNSETITNMTELVSTPVRLKSKSRRKKYTSPIKSPIKEELVSKNESQCRIKEKLCDSTIEDAVKCEKANSKETSPNDLAKECVVVIQKSIFKNVRAKVQKSYENVTHVNNQKKMETPIIDSDTDDIPLCHINKKENVNVPNIIGNTIITIQDDDDDFATNNTKTRKVDESHKQNTKVTLNKSKTTKVKDSSNVLPTLDLKQSQSDDDDDFDFEKKKTILIQKTYEKVHKPLKAKSTGSITQRDIDDLKARIESKKKHLLAKAMTNDTKELRELIKKWQKGCQDALMELMDLMKSKFPDKSNMDYSEILQTLKVPATLVGYDTENDTFITPEDASIILEYVNDL